MRTATVLGAGYMGSAMAFPLTSAGLDVRLWGTWLDDEIVDAARSGMHPRLQRALPVSTTLYNSADLEEAVNDTDVIFIGVSSEGFVPVFGRLLEALSSPVPTFTLTKGLSELAGVVRRTSETARELFCEVFPHETLKWTSIGGPVKAFELARSIPSVAMYASHSESSAKAGQLFQTDYYRVRQTEDVVGVELCGALKNVYAIAVGICDGLYEKVIPRNYHNLTSFLFSQGVSEMATIVQAAGGLATTVYDLAGVGDLFVTAQSGKNQRFGYLLGAGVVPETAYVQMHEEGLLAEGYPALKAGERWLNENHSGLANQLPLFKTLYRVVFEGAPAEESLKELVTKTL